MVEIDYDKIAEISDDFIEYDGVLPLLIRCLIFRKWCKHLMKIGEYDSIMKECIDTMPKDFDEAEKELIDWVKNNPQYKDIII